MSSKENLVGGVPSSVLGMLADLAFKLRDGVIAPQELARFVKRENPFGIIENYLTKWQKFYLEVFGIEADLSHIHIPAERPGFEWLVVRLQSMTPKRLFDKCRERFGIWKYTDTNLDEVITSERSTKDGSYAVWFRDRVEADEEMKNKSANDLKNEGIHGVTFEERLLMELFYHWKTGKHLDIKNVTLCSGSFDSDGFVPSVDWFDDYSWLYVCRYLPADCDDDLRSREAVS